MLLTHWGRDNMDTISQTTFSRAFSSMKIVAFWLNFHWNIFARVQLTIIQHWFRKWHGADQAASHYLNQWWLVYRCIYASLGLIELKQWYITNVWRSVIIMVYSIESVSHVFRSHTSRFTLRIVRNVLVMSLSWCMLGTIFCCQLFKTNCLCGHLLIYDIGAAK